ncbi:NlpC/P60 family protein [Gaiella sp.]|uniref:C40 family peptidase n=1 Tax=Gaiella sp. TaxID=2663207 RepID=UPI003263F31C
MRRLLALAATILLSLGAAGTSSAALPAVPPSVAVAGPSAPGGRSWADAQIRVVTSAGLLGTDPSTFRPTEALTRGELAAALAAWGKRTTTPADPTRLVTMRELHAQLVAALGLTAAAKRIRSAAADAGLAPTGMLGTETIARLLGLRLNHPQGQDQLELQPNQPATRAEAAYSLAQALKLSAEQIASLDTLSQTFSVSELGEWQRTVLTRALRFVGYPYVWAGTSESTQKLWSATAPGGTETLPGGFDCSGFVWRVYKTKPYPGAPLLGDMLKGRTTYSMSGEVKKSARIAIENLEPGDVIFFGSKGPQSSSAEVGHSGIYVGNGWFVHSSSAGVTLRPLSDWYTKTFAWARRPLAEAGLL